MEFIETPVFTRKITMFIDDVQYRQMQSVLIRDPKAGSLIPGAGGLRKLRWNLAGKGKRGGLRVIYYWYFSRSIILMLYAFRKSEAEDISREHLKRLSEFVRGGTP